MFENSQNSSIAVMISSPRDPTPELSVKSKSTSASESNGVDSN